ncbi:glycosyltransferase [uncultured Tateyamaria sp.]|uniref:glycosyltransferase n=1 Tax=uncultured Tateyamaria sp. TaxID=455651 RepID=UPI002635B8A2|nr:glycosyltransferase [uncultured Tateyamaria sp.]
MSAMDAMRGAATQGAGPMLRIVRQIFRLSLLRRFVTIARQDGLGRATAKTRGYLGMQWRGSAHTSLRETAPGLQQETRYLHGVWQQLAQGQAFHVSTPSNTPGHRFVAIIGDLNLPQCRKYRVEQLAGFWHAQGVACEYAHYEDLPRVTRLLSQATHVTEYRLPSTPLTEMLRYEARRLRLPILYDIDDPLFSVSAYETYGNMTALDPRMKQHFLAEAPKYLSMMNGADMISVSTPGLAHHASLYSARPVHVRRNFADQTTLLAGQRARAERAPKDGLFRVAFASGSQGHEADFAEIAEAVEAFVTAAPNRRLLLLGHIDQATLPKALAARTETVPFSTYEEYLTALARADCAVMPLLDDTFNQCKSAVRVIDAATASVPSIVSPVGDLPEMIEPEVTGFVALSKEDWPTHLTAFADDPEQTTRMGRSARHALETRWSGSETNRIVDQEILDWVLE